MFSIVCILTITINLVERSAVQGDALKLVGPGRGGETRNR